jgi:hypothetical protein
MLWVSKNTGTVSRTFQKDGFGPCWKQAGWYLSAFQALEKCLNLLISNELPVFNINTV